MALGDVCHPANPSGILAESQLPGHSVLSKACHPPWRALGESGGPTANPCDLGWVVHGLRICTGMGGNLWECGAVIWVDEL